MRGFTLEAYADRLTKQVLHMDQGVCYNPEYRATRRMHDYPSRKLQIARAVIQGELEPGVYAADIVFASILSGQGERWQNFGEEQTDYTFVSMLCREALLKAGAGKRYGRALLELLGANGGHIADVSAAGAAWREAMPFDAKSRTFLFLDDATAAYAINHAPALGRYLRESGLAFGNAVEPAFTGYEYFACGLIDKGIVHLNSLVQAIKDAGFDSVLTLSGQAEFLFRRMMSAVGIEHGLKVISVLDILAPIRLPRPGYVYAGSFYARMLRREAEINALFPNGDERVARTSIEFNPALEADNRVNRVTMWQPPLCAEFATPGYDEALLDAIYGDALGQMGNPSLIVAFDPHAYNALRARGFAGQAAYFAEFI
jgi:hypothetical protein